MRLNSLTGIEGSPVSSINCDMITLRNKDCWGRNECGCLTLLDSRWLQAVHCIKVTDALTMLGRRAELGLHSVPVRCRAYKCSSH